MDKKYKNRKWLREQTSKNLTQKEIANMCGVWRSTIQRWMSRFDIDSRWDRKKYRNENWLRKKYIAEGLTQTEIANICNVTQGTIGKWCTRFNIETSTYPKTHIKYKKDLQNVHHNRIQVLEKYKTAKDKIRHKCQKCGHIWSARPNLILQGYGCPECNRRAQTKSHEKYVQELKDKFNGKIAPTEYYVNAHIKIEHLCNSCGHKWKTTPHSILGKIQDCPECTKQRLRENRTLTNKEYRDKVKNVHGDLIKVVENYKDGHTKIKHKCAECDNTWEARPNNILRGRSCPHCARSRGEKLVESKLNKLDKEFEIEVRFDDCRDTYPLPFDFGIKNDDKYIGLIEFDGIIHYKPSKIYGGEKEFWNRVRRDKMKDDFCHKSNIPLLRVNYMDKDDEQIESKIKSFIRKIEAGDYL